MSTNTPTRRSERKRTANTRAADLSSPIPHRSRPVAKKRKASNTAPSRKRARQASPEAEVEPEDESEDETPVDDEDDDDDDDDENDLDTTDAVDILGPYLTIAQADVAVAQQYPNSKIEEIYGKGDIKAFAKLCGNGWTYYIQNITEAYFGRAPEAQAGPGAQSTQDNAEDSQPVHIDLGPSKVVSRIHAYLQYRSSDGKWLVHCRGRNGVRVDDRCLKRGECSEVNSGGVIAIAGTEMLFLTADDKPQIHEIFLNRILEYYKKQDAEEGEEEEEEEEEEEVAKRRESQNQAKGPLPAMRGGQISYAAYTPGGAYYGQPAIAPAPANMARPVTPVTSPTKRPNTGSTKKRSPGYRRGIMMESTEQIDYSLESSKDLKPGCSYAAMITWAILSTQEECLSLNGIYQWIKAHFAYYRHISSGWQNSIRHNLSLNTAFEKIARRPDEPGKGMKWRLVPDQRDATIAAAQRHASKGGGRISSAPGSPAGHPSSSGFLPATNGHTKSSPTSRTPPLSYYPPTQPEFTPTRAPHVPLPAYAPTQGAHPVLSEETSPMPRCRVNGHLTAVDSSPTLTSGAWTHDQPMRTPAPRPYNLIAPQPNTAGLPSSYMLPDSSPAPFWKYPGIGSTPAQQWPDNSPVKNGDPSEAVANVQSSSPAPQTNGAESPTRRSVPNTGFAGNQNANGVGLGEEEDGAIDITKGFLNISKFHQQRGKSAASGN